MRPLTYSLPKPMAPLLGRPFIGWIIDRLHKAGVDEIILSCCYLPEAIEAHFGDGRTYGLKLHYVLEREPLGTAGAIRNAAHLIDDAVYVCNGDILVGLDLRELLAFHRSHDAIATIHTRAVDDPSQFGVVETDARGRVVRFVEKPKPGETTACDINAGTYILERAAIDAIPVGRPVSIERETFPHLIKTTDRVFARSTADYWIDVGRPDTYMQAHRDILDGKFEAPHAPQVAEKLWCADGKAPDNGVCVAGPAFMGAGVTLAAGAHLGPYAALYERCVVHAEARIERSVLWPGCRIAKRAVVRDAILGFDVSVREGSVVAPGSVVGRGEVVESSTIA
ncbi:MAG: NDP-sugar synthase [Candidatus Eremiobacteraeota bacterium]|nr:NDP-sugar synthase [Candidatus Eremiobacteraeota bacterium]